MIVPIGKIAFLLLLALLISPAIAYPDNEWADTVLKKIQDLQYQETLNDPFSQGSKTDSGEETHPTPSSCLRHIIACVIDFYEKKGLFESTIGSYKRSNSEIVGLINKIAVFTDANAFVTLNTLVYLMDANRYLGKDISKMITPAVDAISGFHDQNDPNANAVGFWEQKFINSFWVAYANNSIRAIDDIDAVTKALRDACEVIFSDKDCESKIPEFPYPPPALYLPSDTDDTSVNLSVGAMLAERSTDPIYDDAYHAWRESNSPAQIKAVLQQYVDYAYDADGESVASNLIDPRTYYFLSGFYDSGASRKTRIPTTWLLDDEQIFEHHYRGRNQWSTPHLGSHNVNDIDPVELAHIVTAVARLDRSGLLAEALGGDKTLADDLGTIVHNATSYLVYLVSSNSPYLRPDILAPYYAYAEQFYEALANFAAATQGYTPKLPQLAKAAGLALKTMEQTGTAQLIAHHVESGGSGQDPEVYWEGVLRNREIGGAEVVRDRAFSTAAAVSALLDTWTEPTSDGGLRWRPDADASVTDKIVPEAIDFLRQAALDSKQTLTSIAFVGRTSVKSSQIYRYPANHYVYLDGEKIDTKDCVVELCETSVYGVLGFIPRKEYEEMLAKGPFDFGPTPRTAADWGTSGQAVVIWRSEAQAYALALKVLAQFEKIEGTDKIEAMSPAG